MKLLEPRSGRPGGTGLSSPLSCTARAVEKLSQGGVGVGDVGVTYLHFSPQLEEVERELPCRRESWGRLGEPLGSASPTFVFLPRLLEFVSG